MYTWKNASYTAQVAQKVIQSLINLGYGSYTAQVAQKIAPPQPPSQILSYTAQVAWKNICQMADGMSHFNIAWMI